MTDDSKKTAPKASASKTAPNTSKSTGESAEGKTSVVKKTSPKAAASAAAAVGGGEHASAAKKTAPKAPAAKASTSKGTTPKAAKSPAAKTSVGATAKTGAKPAAQPVPEAPEAPKTSGAAATKPGAQAAPEPPTPAAPSAPSADEHASKVGSLFAKLTPWYDMQNHLFSLGLDFWWRRNLVREVVPGPKGVAADLAAGTLDVSLALVRQYPELRVIAVDICEPMLKRGESKARQGEMDRISMLVADARRLPLEDGSVDAVTMAFGIRNVTPREEALAEMLRVLTSGGRACILEFAPVKAPLLGQAYHWYLKNAMPRLAGLISGQPDAYRYFAESIEAFPSPAEFINELKKAGFPFVRHIPYTLGVANLFVATKG